MKKLLFFSAAMLQTCLLLAQNPAKQKAAEQQAIHQAQHYQTPNLKNGAALPDRHLFMIVPESNMQQLYERVSNPLLPANMAWRQTKFEK